jgi:hypothetical protein
MFVDVAHTPDPLTVTEYVPALLTVMELEFWLLDDHW